MRVVVHVHKKVQFPIVTRAGLASIRRLGPFSTASVYRGGLFACPSVSGMFCAENKKNTVKIKKIKLSEKVNLNGKKRWGSSSGGSFFFLFLSSIPICHCPSYWFIYGLCCVHHLERSKRLRALMPLLDYYSKQHEFFFEVTCQLVTHLPERLVLFTEEEFQPCNRQH